MNRYFRIGMLTLAAAAVFALATARPFDCLAAGTDGHGNGGELPGPRPDPKWQVVHKGRTIRQWYELAMDKGAVKLDREAAIQELGRAGRAGAMALWELLDASDRDTVKPFGMQWDPTAVQPGFVRWHAVIALGNLGRGGQPAAPKLAELMCQDQVPEVRQLAAAALAKIGSREPAILSALKKVLRSRDYLVWPNAVQAVGQFHPFDAETLGLLNSLADIDPNGVPGTDSNAIAILNARMAARSCLLRR